MGWVPEEFEAGGQEFRRRGARADEMLEIMKLLWSGEMVEFKGQFFNFNKLEMLPAPKTNIPIYVGGFSEPALNRAARHDGWISDMHSLSELEALIAKLKEKRKEHVSLGLRPEYPQGLAPQGTAPEKGLRARDTRQQVLELQFSHHAAPEEASSAKTQPCTRNWLRLGSSWPVLCPRVWQSRPRYRR